MSFRNCSWPFPLRRLLLPSIHPGDVGDSLGPRIAGQVGHICLNLEGHHETSVRNHLGGEPQCSSLARYTPTPIKPGYAPADRQKVGLRQIASKLATAGKALQIPFFPAILRVMKETETDLSLRVTLMTSRPCVRSVEGNRLVLRTITSRSSPGKRWREESASALSSTSSQFPLKICRSIQPW